VEGNLFWGFIHGTISKGRSPSAPQFWGSPLSVTTLFKEERPHWAW